MFEIEELGTPLSFEWNKCKLETISYGHGIAVTPLQATATYAALTNGGNIIKPTIIKKENYQDNKKIISSQTSKKINAILRKVVTEKKGTASLANIYGYDVGGKTGTSQVIRIQESDRENDQYKEMQKNQLEKFKDHSVFVGYGPIENPKYIASIIIEHGGSGSSLAAPLAHEVLNFVNRLNV